MIEISYDVGQLITYKGELYLIVQFIQTENYIALVCQKDNGGKIEVFEVPKIQ